MRYTLLSLIVLLSGCASPPPLALVSGIPIDQYGDGQSVHVQNGVVYWHEVGAGQTELGPIQSIPAGGGGLVMLADLTFGNLGFDADSLYYEVPDATQQGFDVMKLPLAGGQATQLSFVPTERWIPYSRWGGGLVAGGNVYFMIGHDPRAAIVAVPTSGGDPRQLAQQADGDWPSGNAFFPLFAADSSSLYFFGPVANYGTDFAFEEHSGGILLKMPLAGGPPTKIGTLAKGRLLNQLASDGTNLYYSSHESVGAPLPGGLDIIDSNGKDTELIFGSFNPYALAASGSTVYWTDTAGFPYGVMATHDAHRYTMLATDTMPAWLLSTDGHHLVWMDSQTIWSLAL